jgi:hypothetical protein
VTISQERIRPRRPTRNSISVSNRPAPSGTRRRPEVRGRWVIHPRPFIGPVMLASPRPLTSQNRSSLTRRRSKRDSSLRSPMTFREGEGPILEPIENRSGIGRPVARKYSNAVRALLAMPDHTTKRPGNQNRIFDDRQGEVYRARGQAGPGNDINAGSSGFQKAPTRGLPAWSNRALAGGARRAYPAEPSACQVR